MIVEGGCCVPPALLRKNLKLVRPNKGIWVIGMTAVVLINWDIF